MARHAARRPSAALHDGPVFEPAYYIRRALKLFEECRKQLGDEVELLHDVHERVSPNQAVQFVKDAERFKMFFMEDPLSPEDIAYFQQIRSQCATPIAMGELFNSPHEWTPLITDRLIDYIRIHVSQAGGLTPVRKIAAMAEIFGVKTAWHGPGDVSPIGHAGQRDTRPGLLQLRHPGVLAVQRPLAGSFPRLPGDEGRLPVRQRRARLGHRSGREAGGQVPLRQLRIATSGSA